MSVRAVVSVVVAWSCLVPVACLVAVCTVSVVLSWFASWRRRRALRVSLVSQESFDALFPIAPLTPAFDGGVKSAGGVSSAMPADPFPDELMVLWEAEWRASSLVSTQLAVERFGVGGFLDVVVFDEERGSLRLMSAHGGELVLATAQVATAKSVSAMVDLEPVQYRLWVVDGLVCVSCWSESRVEVLLGMAASAPLCA